MSKHIKNSTCNINSNECELHILCVYVYIILHSVPGAITNVEISNETSSSVKINWRQPYSTYGPIRSVKVSGYIHNIIS